jgi:two-component system, chemotaxis family, response regulator PixH
MSTALIIEDSLTEAEIISSCLRNGGISVLMVKSGEEAIVRLTETAPDIIILDVVLPGCSGFELCRTLKAEDKTSRIPIIMCSTKNSEMDKFWGMKQGADAYIPKPINQVEFMKAVRDLISA